MAIAAAAGTAAVLAGAMMPAASASASAAAAVTRVPCRTPALVSAVSGAASGATLNLARGCTYVLTAALPEVTRDLTINGNGATLHRSTRADTPAFTILTIAAEAEVALNRLSFTNGSGAIMVKYIARLTVTGGVFRGNTAANGGAIGTTAFPRTEATTVNVAGASFIGNRATGDGGAIYANTAGVGGFTDCTFQGNTAAGAGGAILAYTNGIFIGDSTFRGNSAVTGGALALTGGASDVTRTVIHGNRATGNGGGIADGSDSLALAITDSTITGNHAGGAGGGLYETESDQGVQVVRTIIADNSAAGGGGISAVDGIIYLTRSTISGNRDGGGIRSTGAQRKLLSFADSTISGNRAGARGGGVYNQGPLDASGTRITGNRAAGGGGGIYDDGPEATATLTGSSPAGNKPDNCEPPGSITGCTG